MNSGNSSLPPSSDGPGQQPVKPTKGKSGKKRGGQFGHPKRTRPLIPTEDCDRVDQRIIATLLQDLFGLQISDGQISRLQSIGRKAMQAGYDEIVVDVRNSAAVNMDETGWRENGRKAWLWTVVGRLGTLFAVRTSRSRAMATDLLGEKFNGIVVSDRYSAYSHLEDHCHQFCWAHLLRAREN